MTFWHFDFLKTELWIYAKPMLGQLFDEQTFCLWWELKKKRTQTQNFIEIWTLRRFMRVFKDLATGCYTNHVIFFFLFCRLSLFLCLFSFSVLYFLSSILDLFSHSLSSRCKCSWSEKFSEFWNNLIYHILSFHLIT